MAANIAAKNNTDIKGGKVVDIIWGKTWTDDIFGNKLPPIAPIIPIGKARNNSINPAITLLLTAFLALSAHWYLKKL